MLPFELAHVEVEEEATLIEQLLMGALLNDLPALITITLSASQMVLSR